MAKSSAEIIKASFSPGGFNNVKPCVYIIRVSLGDDIAYYVGRTGTSNGTGTSSPFKRLGTHLAKRGNTQSAFWESASDLKKDWFKGAYFDYWALSVERELANQAEKWLIFQMKDKQLLNKSHPKQNVEIDEKLRKRLEPLLQAVQSEYNNFPNPCAL